MSIFPDYCLSLSIFTSFILTIYLIIALIHATFHGLIKNAGDAGFKGTLEMWVDCRWNVNNYCDEHFQDKLLALIKLVWVNV